MLICVIPVLSPIPTKGLTPADVDELARATREKMLEEHLRLSAKAKGQPMAVRAANNMPSKAKSSGIDANTS